jgi:hypothetical protein
MRLLGHNTSGEEPKEIFWMEVQTIAANKIEARE